MASNNDDSIELRGNCPRFIVDVLDAVSQSRRMSRTELVNEVLKTWARGAVHQSMLIARVTKGNPQLSDSSWSDLE